MHEGSYPVTPQHIWHMVIMWCSCLECISLGIFDLIIHFGFVVGQGPMM